MHPSRDPLREAAAKADEHSLGRLLVDGGHVTDAELEAGLERAAELGVLLGEALVELRLITRELLDQLTLHQTGRRTDSPEARAHLATVQADRAVAYAASAITTLETFAALAKA